MNCQSDEPRTGILSPTVKCKCLSNIDHSLIEDVLVPVTTDIGVSVTHFLFLRHIGAPGSVIFIFKYHKISRMGVFVLLK